MIAIVKDKASNASARIKAGALATVEKAKEMSFGDWGSLASIIGVTLWMYDQHRLKKKKKE